MDLWFLLTPFFLLLSAFIARAFSWTRADFIGAFMIQVGAWILGGLMGYMIS